MYKFRKLYLITIPVPQGRHRRLITRCSSSLSSYQWVQRDKFPALWFCLKNNYQAEDSKGLEESNKNSAFAQVLNQLCQKHIEITYLLKFYYEVTFHSPFSFKSLLSKTFRYEYVVRMSSFSSPAHLITPKALSCNPLT